MEPIGILAKSQAKQGGFVGPFKFLVLGGLLLSSVQTASFRQLCTGFLPPNDLQIPISTFQVGGISESDFNVVLDRVEKIYGPDIAATGNRLKVNRLWSNNTVNASAQRVGKDYIINMYGGLARHPATTEEGFALVACHEIGHHLAGAPKVSGWGNNWASNEGASDYFATLKCLRRYFIEFGSSERVENSQIDDFARSQCEAQWAHPLDLEVCLLNSLAGQSVANLFSDLRKDQNPPRFHTPDQRRVTKTEDSHPETQCRLDTYFQGALCLARIQDSLDEKDFRAGSCIEEMDRVGTRPRCWFSPR